MSPTNKLKKYIVPLLTLGGLRPGEKLFEELLMDEEGLQETANKLIYIGEPRIRDQLLEYLCANNIQCDYVFFTGDLRYAPDGDFSSNTIEFLEDICDCVNVSKDHFFIVPGNHDVDLTDPLCLKSKNDIINYYNVHEGIIKKGDLEHIYRGKDNYISLLEQFYDKNSPVLQLSKNVLQPHFVIETEDFNILHVDSTLICSRERDRDLYLGTNLLLDACKKLNQDKPTILLTHYSFDSMDRNEQVVILKLLQEYNIQLWLAGHEHREIARRQRDFFYEFQCGNLLCEDDKTRACIYLGEYNPETYSGAVQLHFWLSPDGWAIFPFLKDHSTDYEFELQDNTSQIIRAQKVINSYQTPEERAFSNSYDQISINQELKDSVLCKNLYQTGKSKPKGIAFDENVWKGFLYLDGSYSPLLELEIYYIKNGGSKEFYITSDSLEFEFKTEDNNKGGIIKTEVSVSYNLSCYTDVSIRLKQFENIRQYLSADTVHIRMINHEEYDIDYKVKCIGNEKWNELNITTNYWYGLMKDIAKIEHYYNVNFVLPQKMSEDDYNAIGTIADSIDCRSCRHLLGIPDEHPGFKKTMTLESDTWLNNGAELPKLVLFGYTFKPTAQFLMKGEFVWNKGKNMWQSDTDQGIPIRVEFDLDEKDDEFGLMREYPYSKGMEELFEPQLCVLKDSEVSYLRYYAKLCGGFKQLQQLYFVYRKQLDNIGDGGFDDRVLIPHSKIYGINGKDIIVSLRKVNGKQYCIQNVPDLYIVRKLWERIDAELRASDAIINGENLVDFINNYNIVKKFLVFNGVRYYVDDINKPLLFYLRKMNKSLEEVINVHLLVNSNAGDLYVGDGIRYFMPSKEQGGHNLPHVHVDVHHDYTGTFSLQSGKQLSGDKFKARDLKEIYNTIISNQEEWMKYWNQHTDGLSVDLNQVLGYVQ